MTARKIIAAVSVALLRDDRLLLVRRAKAPSKGVYAFPGGRVEPGETLEEAARRELCEETGLAAAGLVPHRLYRISGETTDFDLQVFTGPHAGGEPVAASDADDAGFYTLEEIAGLEVPESVMEVARHLLLPARAGTSGNG